MSAKSLLKQYSEERAALVEGALPKAVAIILGRRRVLSGIRWRGDLIVTAAEAIGGAEHVDVRLEGDELGAEVIATDLTTDVAILRVAASSAGPTGASLAAAAAPGSASAATPGVTSASAPDAASAFAPGPASASARGPASASAPGAASASARGATSASAHGATSASAHGAESASAHGAESASTPGATSASAPGAAFAATHGAAPSRAAAPNALRVGEPIVVVGRGLRGPTAIWGSVQLAGPAWSSRRGGRIDQRLELDVDFDPSFEGGAVIDMEGNIVAMAVPGPFHRVLGIPVATIETVVSKVDKFGHLPKPYIGIRLQPLWLDDDTRTKLGRKSRGIAAVGGVDPGSPAAEAHIELGDLLLSLDGEPAESVNGLAQRIANVNPGQTIALEVLRGGKPLTINVQIAERPRH